jgi:hypothetical protein
MQLIVNMDLEEEDQGLRLVTILMVRDSDSANLLKAALACPFAAHASCLAALADVLHGPFQLKQ